MKKKNFFLITCLVVISTVAVSQTQEKQKKWNLKLNTIALIDELSFPTVELGIEKKINNKYSIQTEIGVQFYQFEDNGKADSIFLKTEGYRFRVEGRKYLGKFFDQSSLLTELDGFFIATQLFFRRNTYNTKIQNYYDSNTIPSQENFYDNIGVKKEVYGLNFGVGYQLIYYNFIIEPSFYLGLANRQLENIDRTSDEDSNSKGKILSVDYANLRETSGFTRNISLAFRIGYQF